jgi:hypothetical protein
MHRSKNVITRKTKKDILFWRQTVTSKVIILEATFIEPEDNCVGQ